MDIQYIRKLVKLVRESEIDELEVEDPEARIKIVRRNGSPQITPYPYPMTAAQIPTEPGAAHSAPQNSTGAPAADAPAEGAQYHEIRSPLVGTFYRAPAPEAEAFVQVGQRVGNGTTLCIIEAMKLMNEITSDVNGRVVKILVENAKPVEYNQLLFLIEPS